MKPPEHPGDYYHCFMGNGLDAVLIGYTGAMVEERAQGNLDRCCWYKADRYYPEDRVVPVPGRWPREGQPLYAEGAAWAELAPLAHSWYEVRHNGLRLDVRSSSQSFRPEEGTLYSLIDFGSAKAEVTTFLHASRPLLVIRCVFDGPVLFRACAAPGVWVEEGYDTQPFNEVGYTADSASADYRVGGIRGRIMLALEPAPSATGTAGGIWLEVEAPAIVQYCAVVDDLDGAPDYGVLDAARALGYEELRREHVSAWQDYARQSHLELPDEKFQRFYDYSLYQFKASQNRYSGGLPVNNLRLTWSSHVFWDAYFMHRALLEANRRAEALEGARFLMRTLDHARRHANADFGAPGLKWDWEITHRGESAYGTWVHQKDQVHNNASYANIIWEYYAATRDRAYLAEFFPLLRGLAEFFMANIVEKTIRGYEVRALVDVHERVSRVRNEGLNLSGTIRILEITAQAAAVLSTDAEFGARCLEIAAGLRKTLDLLYNGRYFQAAEEDDALNLSSLAPVYPMLLVPPGDPRALSTARAYLEQVVGPESAEGVYSPWSAGVLATIFAMQGDGDTAWRLIESTSPALCGFGGMSEYVVAGRRWNMQYFSTAQAAVCTAIHHLMLQDRDGDVLLFPSVPGGWPRCSFERLLAAGVEISGRFDRAGHTARAELRNIAGIPLETTVRHEGGVEHLALAPGESKTIQWGLA
jgi:hypothetical protein